MSDKTTPAGWYPDPDDSSQQRYWNGSQWTDSRAPRAETAASSGAEPVGGNQIQPAKKSRVPTPVKWLIGAVGILVLMVACGALISGGSDSNSPSAKPANSTNTTDENTSDEISAKSAAPVEDPVETDPPSLTVAQENAIGQAESYLDMGGFSESGLIQQLKFEGYSKKDATLAVQSVEVDWNEQAAIAAENYMNTSNFSRSGLIDQLEYEGFTSKQATHGADSVGL